MICDDARQDLGPVVVASDGSEASAGGLIIAQDLACALGTSLEVMSVLAPTNELPPPPRTAAAPPPGGATRIRDRRERLRLLCDHALTGQPSYTTRILFGDVASSIARAAESRGARLVVTGRVFHRRIDRATRVETPLAIARTGGVPVLAVPMTARLPRRVVVAVGEGESAASLAGTARALFRDALVIETHDAAGDGGVTIAGFACTAGADLLVVGQVHESPGCCQPIADLATQMFHMLPCAILVVPMERHALRPSAGVSGIA
jgi:nucleotide-binding universal stress UspA family protein